MESEQSSDLVLILMPFWHTRFPPYALARLSSVTRNAGYKTSVFDINLEASDYLNSKLGHNWDNNKSYDFSAPHYNKIHLLLKPIFDKYIEKILALNPKMIGFSLYQTNMKFTYWMANELRSKMPQVKIAVGGAEVHKKDYRRPSFVDYCVPGDGELPLLELLGSLKDNVSMPQKQNLTSKHFSLDDMPLISYSDFQLDKYSEQGTFPLELSRGCTASCAFCVTTSHWKYREREMSCLINEVKYLSENCGAKFISFIDHLLNGNINKLKEFATSLISSELNITWMGFARCNKKMDFDYLKLLSTAGCYSFAYGVESGSQKVLDLMNKKITVEEIDQNLNDTKRAGIETCALWIVGFPGEDQEAFAETLSMLWRHRMNCDNLIGASCTISEGSLLYKRPEKFNIRLRENSNNTLFDSWETNDHSNTCLHRAIRSKLIHILFLELQKFGYVPKQELRYKWIEKDYKIIYQNDKINNQVMREKFDYDLFRPEINPFVDSLVNEFWPLFRTLWRGVGAFEIDLAITPKDCEAFVYCRSNYNVTNHFKIDSYGRWSYKTDHALAFDPQTDLADCSFNYKNTIEGVWDR